MARVAAKTAHEVAESNVQSHNSPESVLWGEVRQSAHIGGLETEALECVKSATIKKRTSLSSATASICVSPGLLHSSRGLIPN